MNINTNIRGAVGNVTRTHTRVQPTTAATLVLAAKQSRVGVCIQNVGSVDVYIGGTGVTTATGQLLPAMYTNVDTGQKEIAEWRDEYSSSAIYAITAASTGDLRVMEAAEASS